MRHSLIAVCGARGGIGASTMALHLAGALGAIAVDGCPGGVLEILAGLENEAGVRWHDLGRVDESLDGSRIGANLPRWRGVRVLSGGTFGFGVDATAARHAVAALRQVAPVVVDVPLAALAPADTTIEWGPDAALVLVAGHDVQSVARGRQALAAWEGDALVALRAHPRMSVNPEQIATTLSAPIGAFIKHSPALVAAAEAGMGPATGTPRWRAAGKARGRAELPDRAAARLADRLGGGPNVGPGVSTAVSMGAGREDA